MTGKHKIY